MVQRYIVGGQSVFWANLRTVDIIEKRMFMSLHFQYHACFEYLYESQICDMGFMIAMIVMFILFGLSL